MQDDTRLATDVYLTRDRSPHGVLLLRTPYNKNMLIPVGFASVLLKEIAHEKARWVKGSKSTEQNTMPEIKEDEFYYTIRKMAQEEDVRTILEIGSSAGTGSTEAFVSGLKENPNKPSLFCMEVSKPRFAELQKKYEKDSFVKCYNASSISLSSFPSEQDVTNFYTTTKTALNNYPVDQVVGWLRQDIDYIKSSCVPDGGIKRIKRENNIVNFGMVLIDGSEFAGISELNEVYGAKIIMLDDINGFKNHHNYHRLLNDQNYSLVVENWKLRNGYAIFKRNIDPLNIFIDR